MLIYYWKNRLFLSFYQIVVNLKTIVLSVVTITGILFSLTLAPVAFLGDLVLGIVLPQARDVYREFQGESSRKKEVEAKANQ